jgi:hypothetical protein
MIGEEVEVAFAAEAKQRQREQARRNQPQADPQKVAILPPVEKSKARDNAAKAVGTSPRYISDAKAIKNAAPDLAKKVKNGEMTIPQAKNAIKKQAKREELAAHASKAESKNATWEIIEGDCLRVFAGLFQDGVRREVKRAIPKGCARLIFADPPYNIGIDYGEGAKRDLLSPEKYMEWAREWIGGCVDALPLGRQDRERATAGLLHSSVDDVAVAPADNLHFKVLTLGHEHALALVMREVGQVVDYGLHGSVFSAMVASLIRASSGKVEQIMRNDKKTIPEASEASPRKLCPICGQPSYSASGVHPQCSDAKNSAKTHQVPTHRRPVSATGRFTSPLENPSWTKSDSC